MELLGLSGAALWGTLLGFGGAAAALYMLRLRRRPVVVPHLALWTQLLADRKSNALWSQLKRWCSLLLALCIIALLVFALGDPRRPITSSGRTLVLLIDASASMQAVDASTSRLEAARTQALRAIDHMQAGDRALVAQLDHGVTPLSQLTDDRAALRTAVEHVHATDLEANLLAGVRFAQDVLLDAEHPVLMVISDGGLAERARAQGLLEDAHSPTLRYLRVGSDDADNLGITAFSVRRYPLDRTQSEVLLRARNYTDAPVPAELELSSAGRVLHRQALQLPAQDDTQLVLENLAGADRTMSARLTTQDFRDALPADDTAHARLPARRRTRVLLVSEGNRYLEAALLLDEYLQVKEAQPGEGLATDSFDAVIYDGWLPPSAPDAPAFYLLPKEPSTGYLPLERRGLLEQPFVGKVAEDTPITRFAALRDLNIGQAWQLEPAKKDRVVAATEAGEPLLVTGKREGHKFVVLSFHPSVSDLPMRVAWPLMVLGALEQLSGDSADYLSSQRAGEPRALTVPPDLEHLDVEAPDGTHTPLTAVDGRASFTADRAGLYRITAPGFDDVVAVQLASAQEGQLRPAGALGKAHAERLRPVARQPTRVLWPWLVAIALSLLALEWLTFHRRWTV